MGKEEIGKLANSLSTQHTAMHQASLYGTGYFLLSSDSELGTFSPVLSTRNLRILMMA
uniref:Uncharacterized protein n=1 Tax=Desertifilum tharense IPPAS B-1220 TaxID=1781255 RepID=A0ACD5GN40_9CYAN